MGKDKKEEFEGLKTAEPALFKPIKCKQCNQTMQWQISKEECLVHCQPCRRAVVVSDWKSNTELLGE